MSTTKINEDSLQNNLVEIKKSQPISEAGTSEQNNFDEQDTTNQIETKVSVYSTIKPEASKGPLKGPLSSLDDLAEKLLKEQEDLISDLGDADSYVTVEGCKKDIHTTTEPVTLFSVNERTQNIVMARHPPSIYPPPPPYDYNEARAYQGHVGQTPVYQQRYVVYAQAGPQDASRAPPYRRNYDVSPSMSDAFDTKQIRNNFVQKVYMILAVQLLTTFGFIALCTYEKNVNRFVRQNYLLLILSIIGYTLICITLFCYEQTRRIFPLNFFLLFLLTAAMAYMTAAISCYYSTYIVMVTFGVSAAVCTLVSIIACQDWFDVTECGMILCLASIVVMVYGTIAMFVVMFTGSNVTFLIYACLVTLLFCMYLMYDTQQILGGRRIELSPEEYILGAITLYVDIMMIFQHMLYLFGSTLDGNLRDMVYK